MESRSLKIQFFSLQINGLATKASNKKKNMVKIQDSSKGFLVVNQGK